MHTTAPTGAAERHKCPVRLTTGPATAGETATPDIPCTRIQLRADVHDMSVRMPVQADAGEPGPCDRGRACRGTAGSEYRSMDGPSGEFGEVAGNPIKLGSAGEPG